MTPSEIAKQITKSWSDHVKNNQSPRRNSDYVYASQYESCTRKMVLNMTHGKELPYWDSDTVARFNRGKDREVSILSQLMIIGRNPDFPFEVVGGQERFELKDHKSRTAIVGKMDARIQFSRRLNPDSNWFENYKAPLEIKSWSPLISEKIHCFSDLFHSPWTRKGAYQLLSYLLGSEEPFGFLLLDRAGLPRLIPVELEPNLYLMEEFLLKAEVALNHKERDTLPDYIQDASECKRCDHYGVNCNPPLLSGDGAVVLDSEIESMLDRREALEVAHDEFEDLDETLKSRLRNIEYGIVGKWLVQGKWGKQSCLELPEELKSQYTVTNLKGRFNLKFVRM